MSNLSFTAAAKLAGISRVTMTKHVRTGKVSTVTGEDGTKKIDRAEIVRVYGTLANDTANGMVNTKQNTVNDLQGKIDALLTELKAAHELLDERAELVQALKGQIALIEHKPASPAADPERPSWVVRVLTMKLF